LRGTVVVSSLKHTLQLYVLVIVGILSIFVVYLLVIILYDVLHFFSVWLADAYFEHISVLVEVALLLDVLSIAWTFARKFQEEKLELDVRR
jgi:hypothetical protein